MSDILTNLREHLARTSAPNPAHLRKAQEELSPEIIDVVVEEVAPGDFVFYSDAPLDHDPMPADDGLEKSLTSRVVNWLTFNPKNKYVDNSERKHTMMRDGKIARITIKGAKPQMQYPHQKRQVAWVGKMGEDTENVKHTMLRDGRVARITIKPLAEAPAA